MPNPEPVIYQLKVALQCISPMIWRRLLVCDDNTIADLNYFIQIAMGRLLGIIEDGAYHKYNRDELEMLQYWFQFDSFDRKRANRRLYDYARGENGLNWV